MLIWLFIGIQLLCTVVYAGSIISVAFSIQILINHFEQNFTFCANQDVTPQIKMHFIFGAICEKQIVSFSYRQRKWIFNKRISTDLIDVCIWLTYSEREKKKAVDLFRNRLWPSVFVILEILSELCGRLESIQ